MKAFWGVLVLIVLIGGGWYVYHQHQLQMQAPAPLTDTQTAGQPASTGATASVTADSGLTAGVVSGTPAKSVTITYSDTGFSPKSVTVPAGGTVTWVNQSSEKMWVASNNHPSHALYDGTSTFQHCAAGGPKTSAVFDECTAVAKGTSYSFTFSKTGTWSYHNHTHDELGGSVVVIAAQ